jgi:uncharacterized protein (DUF2147 family)
MKIKSESTIAAILLVCMLLACSAIVGLAQTPERIEGIWTNTQGTRQAKFYKEGNLYMAKLTETAADDSKVKTGDLIFKNLKWDGKKFNGLASTPKGEMPCTIYFENEQKIKITASKGFMSRSVYWSRIQ